MTRKMTILGRVRGNRVATPDRAYGYGLSSGSSDYVNTQFTKFGQPRFERDGRTPTGYPNAPVGFFWNIQWSNFFINQQVGGTATAAWHPADFTADTTCTGTVNSRGIAANDNIGTPQIYTGPATNCNLQINWNGGPVDIGSTIAIRIRQDGVNLLSHTLIGSIEGLGVFNYPFVVILSVNSVIDVRISVNTSNPLGGAQSQIVGAIFTP